MNSANIKEWWSNLALREKQAVMIGSSLLGLFILYSGIWSPFLNYIDSMRTRIVSEQKTLNWMQTADAEIAKMKDHSGAKAKSVTPVVMLSLLQKQVTHDGLGPYMSQLKQTSNESIQMHFQKVEFDKLMAMLTTILKEQNVTISQMAVSAESTLGVVNADVTVKLG
jgi:type II secretory pathway component PulM